jgi:hypothetical protein
MQTGFIQNDDVVHALPPNRSDQPLNVRILPGGLRSGEDFANAQPLCRFVELPSIDAITVAQQIARRAVPGEKLPGVVGQSIPPWDSRSQQNE